MVGPDGDRLARRGVKATLERLLERSLATYRDFAGEYRVWEGSDFDARGHISAAERADGFRDGGGRDNFNIIAAARPLRAAVARRHSQQHRVLRYFECGYARKTPTETVKGVSENADGLVVYVLGDTSAPNASQQVLPTDVPW